MDATNGNSFVNTGATVIRVLNVDGSNPHTLTVKYPAGYGPDASVITAEAKVILASGDKQFSGFDPNIWGRIMTITTDSAMLHVSVIEPG
jgi:hypothetical protein